MGSIRRKALLFLGHVCVCVCVCVLLKDSDPQTRISLFLLFFSSVLVASNKLSEGRFRSDQFAAAYIGLPLEVIGLGDCDLKWVPTPKKDSPTFEQRQAY